MTFARLGFRQNIIRAGRLLQPAQPRELHLDLESEYLQRRVTVTILLPANYDRRPNHQWPLLLFNDGQDFGSLDLGHVLSRRHRRGYPAYVVAGIHANESRMREYGTSGRPDYAGRGDLADQHRFFVTRELLPLLTQRFRLDNQRHVIAGFSLGALSAWDIAWHHSGLFRAVGCFSGSWWWRSRRMSPQDPDADRIAIDRVRHSTRLPTLQYWLQTGTEDEDCDRNGNGVIDSIDDTLDLRGALIVKGAKPEDIEYVEVEGGRHTPSTWGAVMPHFLSWVDRLGI